MLWLQIFGVSPPPPFFPSLLGVESLQGLVQPRVPQLVWPAHLQRPAASASVCHLVGTTQRKPTNGLPTIKGGGPFKVEVRLCGREPSSLCLCETLPSRVCSSAVLLFFGFVASLFHVAVHRPGMEGPNVGSHQQPSEVVMEEEWGRSCACVSGNGNTLGRSCDVVAVWGL